MNIYQMRHAILAQQWVGGYSGATQSRTIAEVSHRQAPERQCVRLSLLRPQTSGFHLSRMWEARSGSQ
jgi:hypothetical protein